MFQFAMNTPTKQVAHSVSFTIQYVQGNELFGNLFDKLIGKNPKKLKHSFAICAEPKDTH
jgi:hypothetical protein